LNNQVWTIIDLKEKQMHELNSKDLQLKEKKLMLSEKVHIIEDLTLKFNNIKKELSNKKRELTRISNLYETVRESLHKYSKITEYSADNKIEEIYQKIMQKEKEIENYKKELEIYKSSLISETEKLNELSDTNNNIERDINNLKVKNEKLQKEIISYVKNLENSEKNSEGLAKEIKSLETQLSNRKKESSKLKSQINDLEDTNLEKKGNISKITTNQNNLRKELRKVKKTMAQLESENITLINKINNYQKDGKLLRRYNQVREYIPKRKNIFHHTIGIVGNIASGKTTLLDRLENRYNCYNEVTATKPYSKSLINKGSQALIKHQVNFKFIDIGKNNNVIVNDYSYLDVAGDFEDIEQQMQIINLLKPDGIIIVLDLGYKIKNTEQGPITIEGDQDGYKADIGILYSFAQHHKKLIKHLKALMIIYNKKDLWILNYHHEKIVQKKFRAEIERIQRYLPSTEIIEVCGSATTGENILLGFHTFSIALQKK